MLRITLKLPRKEKGFIPYDGDAEKYLNLPIVIGENAVGVITKIIEDKEEYTEVEGMLYKAGVDFIMDGDVKVPADIIILKS